MITPEMTAPYVLGLLKCVRYETKHWLDRVPVLSGAKVSIIYQFLAPVADMELESA